MPKRLSTTTNEKEFQVEFRTFLTTILTIRLLCVDDARAAAAVFRTKLKRRSLELTETCASHRALRQESARLTSRKA
jgi:hypothetical protein